MASKNCADGVEGNVLQKVQPPKLKQPTTPIGAAVPIGIQLGGLPPTKTNLKLMTVLSNSCTVFTGQVLSSMGTPHTLVVISPFQVDCDNLMTPELPVRKISHDLPYQVILTLRQGASHNKLNQKVRQLSLQTVVLHTTLLGKA